MDFQTLQFFDIEFSQRWHCVFTNGKHLFCVAGRFRGDNAVTWFQQDESGRMQFVADITELGEFEGGNSVVLAPDGKTLYATATTSGSLAAIAVDEDQRTLTHLATATQKQAGQLAGASGLAFSRW